MTRIISGSLTGEPRTRGCAGSASLRYRSATLRPLDRLREEALHEILLRVDVRGPHLVNVHPQPNENAWLVGLMAINEESVQMQEVMGMVGERGLEPPGPITRIAVPDYIALALRDVV